ncbi:hypothetical protein GCM10017744_005720 [Streptomyces antimycoticus]
MDTYNAEFSGQEMAHAVRNYQDKGRGTRSLAPFGHGDGGGGPTREMMERARRLANLEGSAKVVIEHPDDFFAAARAEYPDAPVWTGELYLELHRATYTSQARTKQGNRAASTCCARRSCGRRPPHCTRTAPTRTSVSTGCGRRCCSTSSTTSCRARRSPGCTARRRRSTRGWRRS